MAASPIPAPKAPEGARQGRGREHALPTGRPTRAPPRRPARGSWASSPGTATASDSWPASTARGPTSSSPRVTAAGPSTETWCASRSSPAAAASRPASSRWWSAAGACSSAAYAARGQESFVVPIDEQLPPVVPVPETRLVRNGEVAKVWLETGSGPLAGRVVDRIPNPQAPSVEVLRAAYAHGFADVFPARGRGRGGGHARPRAPRGPRRAARPDRHPARHHRRRGRPRLRRCGVRGEAARPRLPPGGRHRRRLPLRPARPSARRRGPAPRNQRLLPGHRASHAPRAAVERRLLPQPGGGAALHGGRHALRRGRHAGRRRGLRRGDAIGGPLHLHRGGAHARRRARAAPRVPARRLHPHGRAAGDPGRSPAPARVDRLRPARVEDRAGRGRQGARHRAAPPQPRPPHRRGVHAGRQRGGGPLVRRSGPAHHLPGPRAPRRGQAAGLPRPRQGPGLRGPRGGRRAARARRPARPPGRSPAAARPQPARCSAP